MCVFIHTCANFWKCADLCRFLRFFLTFVYRKTETNWEYILYKRVWEIFLEISLHFFQKPLSTFIFINCTNLWKFVIIVFNTYLNFIIIKHVYNLPKSKHKIWISFFVKLIQILFIIYPSFLKIFRLPEYSSNFFFNFNKYYSKVILFLNFRCIFSTIPLSSIDILSSFLQISQIFFQKFTQSLNKITVEIYWNFYSGLL